MGEKVSTGFQFLEDDATGDPTGLRRARDGKTFPLAVSGGGNAGIVFPGNITTSLRALRKALDSVKSGVAAAGPIFGVGDSTLHGPNGNQSQSFLTYLVAQLNALGVPASIDSLWGASNYTTIAAFAATDSRATFGAGWTVNTIKTAGGGCFEFPANTTPSAMSFTPASGAAWDQVDIYYYQNSGAALGTFTVGRGGVAPTAGSPVNANTAPQLINKATLTWAAAATGTLNIQVPNNTSPKIRIVGVALRNTASPKLEFINAGWAASSSQDWISGPSLVQTGPWSPPNAVAAASPVALIYNHAVNDFNPGSTNGGNTGPTDLGVYSANLSTYGSSVGNNMIFVRTAQSDPSAFASIASQDSYFAAASALAVANGWMTVDFQQVCGGYTQAQADGLTLDQRHFNSLGNQRGARQLARALLAL